MRTRREIETAFAPRDALDQAESFFLVGIGGAGMSGIARMLARRGRRVRGTDSSLSPVVQGLRAEGIEVIVGHTGDFIEPGDAVVLTDAIDLDASPEVSTARSLGCPLFRRSQALGWMLKHKRLVAVTGSHGKTTTTGMAGSGLRAAGLDPTIVVGADVPEFGGPVVEGDGDWAVIEACEAYDSLRDFDPEIVVLTNLEMDHVDFHGDWAGLKSSVLAFVRRARLLLYCEEDPGAREVASEAGSMARPYSLGEARSRIPGRHNQLNAQAAAEVAREVGADTRIALEAIASFTGAERRLQRLGLERGVTVYDDYAHHPTEIAATLEALRPEAAEGRLVVVFQPHLYSRTQPLVGEFARALSRADVVVLTDIYPARESPIPGVSSLRIVESVTAPCHYVPQRRLLPRFVAGMVRPGDLVVGMGAGDISEFAPEFLQELQREGLRVAVVFGGDSAEREVSIHSGLAVEAALRAKGHDVFRIDVSDLLLGGRDLARLVGPSRPDVCFLAVHGTNAEDGAVQGLLDLLHLTYTGSGIGASALAMDKAKAKSLFRAASIPVPEGLLVWGPDDLNDEAMGQLGSQGWVVKPNAQGSTVGLSFVERSGDLTKAVEAALRYGTGALVEEWVKGTEVSVPVLGDRALPVVEIVPASGTYDFASKYTPGATEEVCPARISPEEAALCQEYALRAHRALECEGCTRTDMIVSPGRIVVLETNTLPGMTPTSLVPRSALAAGMSFEDLCEWMVQDAARKAPKATA
jgi:D-alanine--D-alanine ligase